MSQGSARLFVTIVAAMDALLVWTVPHLGDWYQFWYAGHIVMGGRSPYDVAAWEPALRQPVLLGSAVNTIRLNCEGPEPAACLWRYPPWTALAYAPFGALPLSVGVTLLSIATILAAAAALILLVRLYARPGSAPTLAAVLAVAAQPLVLATRTGHLDGLLLIGAMLVLLGLGGRIAPLVIGTLLLSLKPHLFVPFAVVVVAVLVRRRRWRALALTAGAVGVLALVTSLAYPPPLSTLLGDAGTRASFEVPTVWSLQLTHSAGWPLVVVLVTAAIAAAALGAAWSDRGDGAVVAIGLALSLALAPYEQSYDHVLLLPAVLLAVAAAASVRHAHRRAVTLSFVVAVGMAYPWWAYFQDIITGSQAPSAFVPLLTLVAVATALGVRRAADHTLPRAAATAATSP